MPAAINPHTHPRRHAEHVKSQQAERARALAIGLTAAQVARKLGITSQEAEQLGAKFGFTYHPARKDK